MDEREWEKQWDEYSKQVKESDVSQESHQNPRSLNLFLKENSELFTIIGVFAAVTFYFLQFKDVPTSEIEVGLVSSLVIFVIVGLVIINQAVDEASQALKIESPFLTATYILFALSLSGLLFAIYNALVFYAPSINPTLAFFTSIAIGIFYSVGMFIDEDYRQYEGWWVLEQIIYYAPHFGVIIGFLWIKASESNSGESVVEAADGNLLILTFGIILVHLFSTLTIIIAADIVEGGRDYLQNLQSKYTD
ncbi:hypothetical protein [Halorussus salinus]|uniref:hypothetical protein n=1 Tax=Halorussus salinus TaxID=1364935 RepID=UPI001092E758|nr:hypothetical protein [Halorussus salinus]